MLQANLAIILTFITTLIDELGESENLSYQKMTIIILAFITVILIFNYTIKGETNRKMLEMGIPVGEDYIKNLKDQTGSLQKNIHNISGTINNKIDTTTGEINNISNQLKKSSSNIKNTLNQDMSSIIENSISKVPQLTISTTNTNTTTPPKNSKSNNEPFKNILQTKTNKSYYNNTTQTIRYHFPY